VLDDLLPEFKATQALNLAAGVFSSLFFLEGSLKGQFI